MRALLAVLLCSAAASAAPVVRLQSSVTAPLAAHTLTIPLMGLQAPAPLFAPAPLTLSLVPAPSLALTPAPAPAAAPTALQGLSAIVLSLQPQGPAFVAPSIGDAFDGRRPEEEGEEEFARKEEKKAKEVRYAHADVPVLDYRGGAYSQESAERLLDEEFMSSDERAWTGRDLLALIVTPAELPPDTVPDPSRIDLGTLGLSSLKLREVLAERGLPVFRYEAFLKEAFNEGLVYRLTDAATGKTYHGVPARVRAELGLTAPAGPGAAAKAEVSEKGPSAFSLALDALVEQAKALPKGEELVEFTGDVSAAFASDPSALADALLTLRDSAEGTPWEARVEALCRLAVAEGLLAEGRL